MKVQKEMRVFRGTITERLFVEWPTQRSTERLIPFVFHWNGRPIKDYYGTWRKACKAAKIPNRIAHVEQDRATLDLLRAWSPPFNPSGVITECAEILKPYRATSLTGDRHSAE